MKFKFKKFISKKHVTISHKHSTNEMKEKTTRERERERERERDRERERESVANKVGKSSNKLGVS